MKYKYNMLSKTYLGSQKDILIKTAIYVLWTQIYSSWKDKKVFIALFRNITGIFDNVLYK